MNLNLTDCEKCKNIIDQRIFSGKLDSLMIVQILYRFSSIVVKKKICFAKNKLVRPSHDFPAGSNSKTDYLIYTKVSCVEFSSCSEISWSQDIVLWRQNRRIDTLISAKLPEWSFLHTMDPYKDFEVSRPHRCEDIAIPKIWFEMDVQTNKQTDPNQKFRGSISAYG